MYRILVLVLISVLMSACSKSGGGGDGERKKIYQGDLFQLYTKINAKDGKSPFFSKTCDAGIKDFRIQLVKALEDRRVEIENMSGIATSDLPQGAVQKNLGSIVVTEIPPQDNLQEAWNTYERTNWGEMIRDFEIIKNTPVDKNWVKLNSRVRGIALDDQYRILGWGNMDIKPTSEPELFKIREAVNTCAQVNSCTGLTGEAFVLSEKYAVYRILNGWLRDYPKESLEIKKEYLEVVTRDYERTFQLDRHSHLANPNDQSLTIRFSYGSLGPAAEQLEKYFTEVWSKFGMTVKIQWHQNIIADVFKFELGNAGARAFVNPSQKIMSLGRNVIASTISHEFGHVLGLPDEYYTLWNDSTCTYSDMFDSSNIMSDHYDGGGVKQYHIENIKKMYF